MLFLPEIVIFFLVRLKTGLEKKSQSALICVRLASESILFTGEYVWVLSLFFGARNRAERVFFQNCSKSGFWGKCLKKDL